jgi:hypothetical protein
MTLQTSFVPNTQALVPTGSPASKVEKLDIAVQQQVELALDTWVPIPGSAEYIRVLINGWDTHHMRHYIREVLSKDQLLSEVFEVTSAGLTVKSEARILEAHFGDYISSVGKQMNLRVVPGVILKRLISAIFSIDLYSSIKLPPVSIQFLSGVTPGAVLSFANIPTPLGTASQIPTIALNTTVGGKTKSALNTSNGAALSVETIEELLVMSQQVRRDSINLDPQKPSEYLAQGSDFRFALNSGVIDSVRNIFQTDFRFPQQILTHAALRREQPSITFIPNQNGDREVPWETVEEAVCQAATIAVQKYIFSTTETSWKSTLETKKSTPTVDTLIVLSESTPRIHRLVPMREQEVFKITLRVTPEEQWNTQNIEYIVTSGLRTDPRVVISGTIRGTRISKIALARTLRTV